MTTTDDSQKGREAKWNNVNMVPGRGMHGNNELYRQMEEVSAKRWASQCKAW